MNAHARLHVARVLQETKPGHLDAPIMELSARIALFQERIDARDRKLADMIATLKAACRRANAADRGAICRLDEALRDARADREGRR